VTEEIAAASPSELVVYKVTPKLHDHDDSTGNIRILIVYVSNGFGML